MRSTMKTLWVAVVLSFVSVCQPAPLACNELSKPVEKGPDFSGRWNFIALSTRSCFPAMLFNSLFWPSVAVDFTPKSPPNIHSLRVFVKMYGICAGNETVDFFYENSKLFDVNSENAPIGDPDMLLHTSCSDCIILKTNDSIETLSLLSRRPTISADELKEFEVQARCVGFSTPQVFNTDRDFDNCENVDYRSKEQSNRTLTKMYEQLESTSKNLMKCLVSMLLSYF